MENIDYAFIIEIYARYIKHLNSIIESIGFNQATYARQLEELERLVKFKPHIYRHEIEKVKEKIKEADIKLSHIVPRVEKLIEQSEKICKEKSIPRYNEIKDKDSAWTGK